jgi:hypothetical protein
MAIDDGAVDAFSRMVERHYYYFDEAVDHWRSMKMTL